MGELSVASTRDDAPTKAPRDANAGGVHSPQGTPPNDVLPCVEIGWVLASAHAGKALDETVLWACRNVEQQLQQLFPHYQFRSALLRCERVASFRETVDLIDVGARERHKGHWDFACVVSEEDLHSYDKPYALGAPASALNVCVLSTARLGVSAAAADQVMLSNRITALFFHLFGHLNDLTHSTDFEDYMHPPRTAQDLDRQTRFSPKSLEVLDLELAKEADLRVEEEARTPGVLQFYLDSTWRNRRDIAQAVLKTKPWTFLVRLNKMTTTAASTLIVLMLTAESWDLGTSQSGFAIAAASMAAITLTAAYVLRKQGLLARERHTDLTEQRVAANVSVVLIVGVAMATTYAILFVISFGVSAMAFSEAMLKDWINTVEPISLGDRALMAGFVATLGVVLGALGATFEGAKYFRHAAIVDEET